MKNKSSWIGLIVILVLIEMLLRVMGFCDLPTYIESERYEYRLSSDQDREFLGKRFITNRIGMRSVDPDTSKKIVMVIGSSVINGGVSIGHDSLSSSILEKNLGKGYQVLNVSAEGWGVDNMAKYVQTFGWFGAEAMILCISSRDLNNNMTFAPILDEHPLLISKNNISAIYGVIQMMAKEDHSRRSLDPSMKGYEFFKQMSKLRPVYFYIHPTQDEINENTYSRGGGQIVEYMKDNNLNYFDGLKMNPILSDYQGSINLNNTGQRNLADRFFHILK